jgi:ABC-2 type transport system permease protein
MDRTLEGTSAPRPTWRALYELSAAEALLFWREPAALFFTIAFPVLLLLLIGVTFGSQEIGGGFRLIDIYAPGLLAMVIASLGLISIPITLANYREEGILKRYQVSPLPLWGLIVAHLAVNGLMFLISAVLVVGLGAAIFQIYLGGNFAGLFVAALLSLGAFFGIGLALASLTSSVRTAQAVGNVVYFVLLFTSGLTAPRSEFPEWLQRATDYLPLTLVVDMFAGLWLGASLSDYWPTLLYLLVIIAVTALIVRRYFRWQA